MSIKYFLLFMCYNSCSCKLYSFLQYDKYIYITYVNQTNITLLCYKSVRKREKIWFCQKWMMSIVCNDCILVYVLYKSSNCNLFILFKWCCHNKYYIKLQMTGVNVNRFAPVQ